MNRIVSALFSLLGVSALFSCKQKAAYETAPNGKSLLWEVSGNGLTHPSYFLGTMHLMCAEDAVLSSNVKQIIKQVDTIYLEVDLDNASELLSGMADLSMGSDTTLKDVLNEKDYEKVKTFFEKYDASMPFAVLEKQMPLMLSSTLYELLLPCPQKNGVEMKIVDEAYKQKKETKGLETMAFQAAILAKIPYEAQARELVATIDSLPAYEKSLQQMLAVYKTQDIDKLYELSAQESGSTSDNLDELLFNRNRNWVEKFKTIAKNNSLLIAVGAGHLGGDKGVINLLKQHGYTVRPLVN